MSDKVRTQRSFAERVVVAEVQAVCPFSIAEEYAVDYLRRAQAHEVEAEVRVPIRFLPTFVHWRMAVTFCLHRDIREAGRRHNEIRVRWVSGTPLLPEFHGTVRLRIAGSGTLVLVEGSYRAPFDGLGRLFDQLVGSHIARSSVRDLTHRIARSLEARERDWRARIRHPLSDTAL